ncbi:MAG: EAL domain-containing protein [Sulfurimonas sp.]|jgi:diguanylate cyclase (GGDEF)-like protein
MKNIKELQKLCKNFSVLLVDDEVNELNNFAAILKNLFKDVTTAANGAIALKRYKEKKSDLIITDLVMPVMDGLGLIDEIRKIDFMQRIIILSASSDISSLIRGISYSVDGYIFKPVEMNLVISTITRAMNIIILEQQNREHQYNLEEMVKEQILEIENYSKTVIEQLEYDRITHLPNKQKLQLDFDKRIFKELLIIDIDNFENINLAYGFEDGDKIIKLVGEYLTLHSAGHQVYHINGDEFLIAIKLDSQISATEIANSIKDKIYSKSFELFNASIRITFTFGIVEVQNEKIVPYNKLHSAIKEIRQISKNSIGHYHENSSIIEKQKAIQSWSQKIKIALDLDLVEPFYQPIYDLEKDRIVKYECLVRIVDGAEVILPIKFLEAAKISGFLSSVTKRVISKAFEYFSATDYRFSINITDDDLKENYLKEYLQESCKKYEISPQNVILEVLENISEYDATHAVNQLKEIKELGFKISIDDFGAESSNFGRVQKLSVDFLKIDGVFVKDIDTNKNSLDITSTIIHYAAKSGIKTIAEFVHSKEVFDIVKGLGVDFVQGYYIGQPSSRIIQGK